MLLQSAGMLHLCAILCWGVLTVLGFLDIDKLIEYRPPEENLSFWKRPVAPQREKAPIYCS
jgi:hypothetical protein